MRREEGGWCSYILSTVWICSIDFTLGPDVTRREIALLWAGSLNVITKEDFVTPFNFNTFSPYNKVDNWRWYMRVNLYRCLSRVYCAWNCWGWGLFEWGGLARELRTLMEGPAPRHVGGLWKLDMKPLCAKYFHISLYCTSLDLSSSKIFW